MNVEIGDFVIIGVSPRGRQPGDLATHIGSNALRHSHTVLYAGNVIGKHFQTGHDVLIRELNEIGDDVSIGSHSVIEHHVKIGHRGRIHSNAFIPEYSILEEDTWVGPLEAWTEARRAHASLYNKRIPTNRRLWSACRGYQTPDACAD